MVRLAGADDGCRHGRFRKYPPQGDLCTRNAARLRNLGGAIGLAGINTIMQDRLALHWMRLVENLTPGNPTLRDFLARASDGMSINLGEAGDAAATRLLANMVRRQADVLTFSDVLLMMAAVFFASVLLIPLLRKPRPAPKAGGAH